MGFKFFNIKSLVKFGFWIFIFGFLAFPSFSRAALLYSQAANQVVGLDQTFTVDWYLDTQGQAVNSVDLELQFTPGTLEVVDASAGSSGLNLWIQTPKFDNDQGIIDLIGGVAGGFNTSKFPVFRTTFQGKALGAAKVSLKDSSEVLLSDGLGTKMKLSFAELNFPVVPAAAAQALVTSPTHPDQAQWYQANSVKLQVHPQDGESYSYSFSSNAELIPDDAADDVPQELSYENLPDGIYYFKINSKAGSGNWEEAGVYRVMIDQTSPESFAPVVASDPSVFDGKPFVSFATTDKVSGVKKYAIKVGVLGAWIETDNTYYVIPAFRLSDQIEVKAIDSAGNEQLSKAKVSAPGINFSKWLLWIIIGGSILGIIWFIKKAHQRLKVPKIE